MKRFHLLLSLLFPILIYSQTDYLERFTLANNLLEKHKTDEAYTEFKKLEKELPESDALYPYVLLSQVEVTTYLEQEHRISLNFEESSQYGSESLELIRKGFKFFNKNFESREAFMIRNLIISNTGLNKYETADEYRGLLYKLYKEDRLPDGINTYFNFDHFKWEDKNIWGYEWYSELPKDRFSQNFTKIVYYVYSTKPDGSDNQQLYRLQLVMFHAENPPFDYLMTKYLITEGGETSKSLYAYTYKEDIDFEKLRKDVIRIIEGKSGIKS